jgi:hypothetical protein
MDISIMKIGRRLIPHRKGKWLSNLFNECRGGASTGGGYAPSSKYLKLIYLLRILDIFMIIIL